MANTETIDALLGLAADLETHAERHFTGTAYHDQGWRFFGIGRFVGFDIGKAGMFVRGSYRSSPVPSRIDVNFTGTKLRPLETRYNLTYLITEGQGATVNVLPEGSMGMLPSFASRLGRIVTRPEIDMNDIEFSADDSELAFLSEFAYDPRNLTAMYLPDSDAPINALPFPLDRGR